MHKNGYTPRDFKRAVDLWFEIVGVSPLHGGHVAKIAKALARERDEFARAVNATADDDEMLDGEVEKSLERLTNLLIAEDRGEDPSTFGRFAASACMESPAEGE